MSDILVQLNDKKRQITDLQNKKARLDGSKDQLLKDLMSKFSLSSIEEAKNNLEELKKELEENKNELVKKDEEMGRIISQA